MFYDNEMKNEWKKEQHRQRKLAAARLKKERLKRDYEEREAECDYWHYKQRHPGIVIHDLTGFVFGDLTVVKRVKSYVSPEGKKLRRYLCRCSCGDMIKVYGFELTGKRVTSCGCYIQPKQKFKCNEDRKMLDEVEWLYRVLSKTK